MKKELKVAKNMNFPDVVLLWMISFIFIYAYSRVVPFKITALSLKEFSNIYSIFWNVLITLLVLFLVMAFKLKISGNLTIFFKKKNKEYLTQALKDSGFKKGEILKRWPFYLSGIIILGVGAKILGSIFNEGLIYNPKLYLFLVKGGTFQFANFLGKAILFFAIFDYFLSMLKSRKLAYIYSAVFLLIAYLSVKLFNGNITIIGTLKDSFIVAPWMMVMYYWADNSIYYSWILMSTFQTLGLLLFAIQFNIFKI